jgi:transcriptional antiterminator RfaH
MDFDRQQLPEYACWFCLRSQLKHEHIAAANLRKIEHVEVFSPRLRFRKATRQGPVWVTESMFPNYLFAKFYAREQLNHVSYSHGVSRVVAFGGRYAKIPDETITTLRVHLGEQDVHEINPAPQEGDLVELARGSFVGLQAIVTQVLPGSERVRILMDFLGRQTECTVSAQDILPVMAFSKAR